MVATTPDPPSRSPGTAPDSADVSTRRLWHSGLTDGSPAAGPGVPIRAQAVDATSASMQVTTTSHRRDRRGVTGLGRQIRMRREYGIDVYLWRDTGWHRAYHLLYFCANVAP